MSTYARVANPSRKKKKGRRKKARRRMTAAQRRAAIRNLNKARRARRSHARGKKRRRSAGERRNPVMSTKKKSRRRRKHRVRAHMSNPRKVRRRRRRSRRNPGMMGLVKQGGAAVLFGGIAALLGIGAGFAVSKLPISGKAALVSANAVAGLVAGGVVGAIDPAAGRQVAHNFFVTAGQYALAPSGTQPTFEPNAPQVAGVSTDFDRLGPGDDNIAGVLIDADDLGDVYSVGGAAYDYAGV